MNRFGALVALALLLPFPAQARWFTGLGAEPGERVLNDRAPAALDGVGIEEHLGGQIPLDVPLTDSDGESRSLAQILQSRRPVLLTFNYSSCPMLCSLQLEGLVGGLKQISARIGRDYDVVTVSMDPNEAMDRAQAFRGRYLEQYGDPTAAAGWHFLRGPEAQVRRWSDAAGFKYKYLPDRDEYAHTAAVMWLTADGVVARYLYGIQHEPRDLRLAVAEAAQGRLTSTVDRILLYCFHYDATVGRYAPVAANVMRLGGALVAVLLAAFLGVFWWRYERRPQLPLTAEDA